MAVSAVAAGTGIGKHHPLGNLDRLAGCGHRKGRTKQEQKTGLFDTHIILRLCNFK
jgi:hypothetical protein